MMRMQRLLAYPLFMLVITSGTVQAADGPIQRGRVLVQNYCAPCHATGPTGDSPMPQAPTFRSLSQRYPIEALSESLAEGIMTGHPSMPEFKLEPGQITDLILYLKSVQR